MGEVEGKVNGHGQAEQPQAIISAPTAAIDPYAGETAEQLLSRAQQQITLHQGIVKLIAANLSPKSVMLFGDNIWLTKEACLRVLGWIGADVLPDSEIGQHRYDSTDGPYIVFESWGTITLKNGRQVRAVGNSSTLDEFFAKENIYVCPTCQTKTEYKDNGGYCPKCQKAVRGEKKEYYKPLTEVDIPSIRLKAVTNFYNHALQTLGAMPTKDELIAAGMKIGEGGKVDFKKTSQNPPAKPQGAAATTSTPQTAAPAPSTKSLVPKANLGGDQKASKPLDNLPVGKGIISEVIEKTTKPKNGKGGGTPFLEVIQNGHSLYCFKNSEIETMEGPEKTFWLIKEAKGQFCEFMIETKTKDNRPMHSIVGAVRVGRHSWDRETGEAVKPTSEGGGYQATNEDIPW